MVMAILCITVFSFSYNLVLTKSHGQFVQSISHKNEKWKWTKYDESLILY